MAPRRSCARGIVRVSHVPSEQTSLTTGNCAQPSMRLCCGYPERGRRRLVDPEVRRVDRHKSRPPLPRWAARLVRAGARKLRSPDRQRLRTEGDCKVSASVSTPASLRRSSRPQQTFLCCAFTRRLRGAGPCLTRPKKMRSRIHEGTAAAPSSGRSGRSERSFRPLRPPHVIRDLSGLGRLGMRPSRKDGGRSVVLPM